MHFLRQKWRLLLNFTEILIFDNFTEIPLVIRAVPYWGRFSGHYVMHAMGGLEEGASYTYSNWNLLLIIISSAKLR